MSPQEYFSKYQGIKNTDITCLAYVNKAIRQIDLFHHMEEYAMLKHASMPPPKEIPQGYYPDKARFIEGLESKTDKKESSHGSITKQG